MSVMNPQSVLRLSAMSAPGTGKMYIVDAQGGEFNVSPNEILALGGIAVGGTPTFAGAATFSSTATFNGAATFNSTATVNGVFSATSTSTFSGETTFTKSQLNPVVKLTSIAVTYLSQLLANTHAVVVVDTTAADFTVLLPKASTCVGRAYAIKKVVAANTLTIDVNDVGDTIFDAAAAAQPVAVTDNGAVKTLVALGNVWYVF